MLCRARLHVIDRPESRYTYPSSGRWTCRGCKRISKERENEQRLAARRAVAVPKPWHSKRVYGPPIPTCPNGGPFMRCDRCATGVGHFKIGSPEYAMLQRSIIAARLGLTVEQLAAQVRARRTARNRIRAHRRRVLIRVAGSRSKPRFLVLHMEAERRRGTCYYCGVVARPGEFDHVIPLSRGGDEAVGNLVLACVSCNQSKGDRLVSEWRHGRVRNNLPHRGGEVVALGTPDTVVALVAEPVSRSAA